MFENKLQKIAAGIIAGFIIVSGLLFWFTNLYLPVNIYFLAVVTLGLMGVVGYYFYKHVWLLIYCRGIIASSFREVDVWNLYSLYGQPCCHPFQIFGSYGLRFEQRFDKTLPLTVYLARSGVQVDFGEDSSWLRVIYPLPASSLFSQLQCVELWNRAHALQREHLGTTIIKTEEGFLMSITSTIRLGVFLDALSAPSFIDPVEIEHVADATKKTIGNILRNPVGLSGLQAKIVQAHFELNQPTAFAESVKGETAMVLRLPWCDNPLVLHTFKATVFTEESLPSREGITYALFLIALEATEGVCLYLTDSEYPAFKLAHGKIFNLGISSDDPVTLAGELAAQPGDSLASVSARDFLAAVNRLPVA